MLHADTSSAGLSDVQSALNVELARTQGLDHLPQVLLAEVEETCGAWVEDDTSLQTCLDEGQSALAEVRHRLLNTANEISECKMQLQVAHTELW
jgi:hypothetical protein